MTAKGNVGDYADIATHDFLPLTPQRLLTRMTVAAFFLCNPQRFFTVQALSRSQYIKWIYISKQRHSSSLAFAVWGYFELQHTTNTCSVDVLKVTLKRTYFTAQNLQPITMFLHFDQINSK